MSGTLRWQGYADEHSTIPGAEIVQGLDLYWERGRADAAALLALAERLSETGGEDGKQQAALILRNIAREHLPDEVLRIHRDEVSLGPSLRAEIAVQRQLVRASEKTGGHSPGSPALTQRGHGRSFAAKLKLPVVPLLQRNVPWAQIHPAANTVIKPVRGDDAQGVFLVFAEGDILELSTGERFSGWQKLRRRARQVESHVDTRRWTVEEMLQCPGGGPALSLQFLTFYGEVALVRETVADQGTTCWYDREGNVVRPCATDGGTHSGGGIPAGAVEKAEQISRKVPAPFLAIGALSSEDGLYYGEFNTEPSGIHDFTLAADRILGQRHIEAQARLYADMLGGTAFSVYKKHSEAWAKKANLRGSSSVAKEKQP